MKKIVVPRRTVVGLAAIGLFSGASSGCLPLPGPVTAQLCAAPSTYVPESVRTAPKVVWPPTGLEVPEPNAALLERLRVWPTSISVSPTPVVSVGVRDDAGAAEAVAALRKEFGSAIDIEVGAKRLGGGPSGSAEACLIEAPRWAFGAAPPKGVSVIAVVSSPSFDRAGPVSGALFVTNRTRRPIGAQQVLNVGDPCDNTVRGAALTAPGSGLAVNDGGLTPAPGAGDPDTRSSLIGGSGWSAQGGTWAPRPCTASLPAAPPPVVLRTGQSTAFTLAASTSSRQAGADRLLTAGTYELRALITIDLAPAAPGPTSLVAAPPVPVQLHG